MENTTITCKYCGGKLYFKDGTRQTPKGEIQRYLCRICGTRFS